MESQIRVLFFQSRTIRKLSTQKWKMTYTKKVLSVSYSTWKNQMAYSKEKEEKKKDL